MKIRHIVFSLLPALAVADNATVVPDDEPLLPPLPEELLSPQKGQEGLPATARPVVSYRAPKDEEQTWLKLFYLKPTDEWPDIFRRMASASREKDMEMCHGYALWLKGQQLVHLRYDDDLSLSGIHADGHTYGVLYVEFSPYGIRVSPMEGYDLTGKNGGICWQNAASKLWSWAESSAFWAELPKLLRADSKTRVTSAQDSAVKRDVATKGQRMVVFWASAGYPVSAWWPSFMQLHALAGDTRFSLVAADGLRLWPDVVVPGSGSGAPAPAAPPAAAAPVSAEPLAPPTPVTKAPLPESLAPPPAGAAQPPAPQPGAPATPHAALPLAPVAPPPAIAPAPKPTPEAQRPAPGSPGGAAAPAGSVRPRATEGNVVPVPGTPSSRKKSTSPSSAAPATPATPASTPPPAKTAAPSGRTIDAVNAVVVP